VDVASYAQYAALSDRLRALGLVEDSCDGAPLCRWRSGNLIVDVMPTDERVLGFSNRWYPIAIDSAWRLDIAGHRARIVTPAMFIATKLAAFHGRGHGDVVASHDLEDVVTIIDGRPEILNDVADADDAVRAYISAEIRSLLDHQDFREALSGFLLPDVASQARRTIVERRLKALARRRPSDGGA
jgi:hypothetical protein